MNLIFPRYQFLLLLIPFILNGCTQQEKQSIEEKTTITTEVIPFDNFIEDFYQQGLLLNPIEATREGDNRYNHLLRNDLTIEYREELSQFYSKTLSSLKNYKKSELSKEQQISYDVLKWEASIGLESQQFWQHLLPIDQFWTTQLAIGTLASGGSAQPFNNKKDYDDWRKRVTVFTQWCDTAIINMQEGIERGVVLPRALTKKVIPQLAVWIDGPAEKHHFYLPVKNIPDSVSSEDATLIKNEYASMINLEIIPAINRLHTFFSTEYLTASRDTSGINVLPRGNDWYQFLIKFYTTTDMTADEVFNLGKSEVARLRSEMETVMSTVGFDGNLQEFFDYVRSKPELIPFKDPAEVIANFNAIHQKMKPQLSKLFDLTPKSAFEVRRTESFREASASAEYNAGSKDGTRPGIFYVPIPDITKYNYYADEDLFLHEAIPGHHYQSSLAQENDALPSFRKTLWYSAYGEGWALYSESLGEELGLYDDPYQYFGMLSAEMHRAIRLVVDAGMHSKGWTREQAIQYSLENEAEPEASIISEIERYMAGPGQALSYKIGQLKIRELRQLAEQKLGDKFDIRIFHNKVLESGSVPLALLETKILAWINDDTN